jgi:hypothetical protein
MIKETVSHNVHHIHTIARKTLGKLTLFIQSSFVTWLFSAKVMVGLRKVDGLQLKKKIQVTHNG